MKILMIDTCGATGSVALADTDCVPAKLAWASLPGRTASERLVGTIKDLTAQSGISLGLLNAVVVVHGPGSFTGVRVGLSTAKGLCEALSLPLIAISRLAVLTYLANPPGGASVYALLDAGRGEFYVGKYVDGVCVREALLDRDELRTAIDGSVTSALSGFPNSSLESARVVVTCESSVAESVADLFPQLVAEPTAGDVLPLALRRILAQDFDEPATLDANYLRRTDAEIFAKPRPRAATEHQLVPPARCSTNFDLRHALGSDVDEILALERATDNAPHWPRTAYAEILDLGNPWRCLIVAQAKGVLTGFAVGLIDSDNTNSGSSIAELESVVVAANARRAGIGRALCEAVTDYCRSRGAKEIVLEVRASSSDAIALYCGLGFEQTGRRPHYYRDPEDDAVILRLGLGSHDQQ